MGESIVKNVANIRGHDLRNLRQTAQRRRVQQTIAVFLSRSPHVAGVRFLRTSDRATTSVSLFVIHQGNLPRKGFSFPSAPGVREQYIATKLQANVNLSAG